MNLDLDAAFRNPERLAALRRSGLLDTPPEEAFDRLAALACRALDVPGALISLVDDEREFFKSCVGLPAPLAEVRRAPLTDSFCARAVAAGRPVAVAYSPDDEASRANRLVGEMGVVAYLAVPLVTSEGHAIGAFCVTDTKRRPWTEEEVGILSDLSASAASEVELRAVAREVLERAEEVARIQRDMAAVLESMNDAFFALDRQFKVAYVNRRGEELSLRRREEIEGRPAWEVWPTALGEECRDVYANVLAESVPAHFEVLDGASGRWIDVQAYPSPEGMAVYFRDVTGRKAAESRIIAQHRATRALAASASLEEAAPGLLSGIGESLGWSAAALWRVDPEGGVLRCVAVWLDPSADPSFAEASLATTFPPGLGPPGRVWASGTPEWVPDVARDPAFPRASAAARASLHAGLACPVTSGREVLGVIELFSPRSQPPDASLLEMMADVGSQIGAFVERTQAERDLAFQKSLLESQTEAAIDGILVLSGEGHILSHNRRWLTMWEIPEPVPATSGEELLAAMAGRVADPGTFEAAVRRLAARPDEASHDEVALADGRTFDAYSASIRGSGGAHYGRVWFFRDVTERKGAEEASARLLALEHEARMVSEAAERRLAFLSEASRILSGSLDYSETLASVARLAVPYLADWCTIHVAEPDRSIRRVAVAHIDPDKIEFAQELERRYPTRTSDRHPVCRVMAGGRPEIAPDIDDQELLRAARDPDHLEILRGLGLASYMCVPMVARGRTLGVITFVSAASGRRYGQDDLVLAGELAARAALAVDNARLYQERSRVARTLQESLLPPRLPLIRGIDLAARYRPAGEATDIGGDFYDTFRVGRRRWMIVMGDVCGKGVEAAALTALARYTLRAAAMQEREPSRVLQLLNEAIRQQVPGDRFCTVACGRLDLGPGGARLTVASGGHPLPLLLRADGRILSLGRPGTLLGIFADPDVADEGLDLGPGDTVVFFTDGLTEAGAPGAMSREELAGVLATCRTLDAAATAELLERAALDAQPGNRRDDAAILALRILPSAGPAGRPEEPPARP